MKLLFICTHNRCRSILAEAITNHLAGDAVQAASAGSQPAGVVHPLTLKLLAERGMDTRGLRSQSWDEFDTFEPDAVITVCDSAAGESCPLWMGKAVKVHWGLPDPSRMMGTEAELRQAFGDVMDTIAARIEKLKTLPLDRLANAELQQELHKLADVEAD